MVLPKSYSIIVVPSDHSGTRQYLLSRSMLIILAVLAAAVLGVMVFFAMTYGQVLMEARRAQVLDEENRELQAQVALVGELSRELERMSALRAQVVEMLGQDPAESEPLTGGGALELAWEDRALGNVDRLQQLFADEARFPFAPRVWPASGRVRREFYAQAEGGDFAHPGLSIQAPEGTPIVAAGRGRIIDTRYSDESGHVIVIDHGYGYQTVYANLSRVLVSIGQRVEREQPIGEVHPAELGSAKRGSRILPGALYFELRVDGTPVDPRRHLDAL